MVSRGPRVVWLAVALALAATGCVESGTFEKAATQLEEARRAGVRRDVELRAYEWQLATLGQQLREAQQRSDALQRELYAQVQQLTAANAGLVERMKRVESERAALLQAAAEPPPPTGRDARRDGAGRELRPDEVRRLLAAADARNAQILEELARIERALASGPRPQHPAAEGGPHPTTSNDVVDPWGFGSRK